jgi:hypothetical protein
MNIRYKLSDLSQEAKSLTHRIGKVRFPLRMYHKDGPLVRRIVEALRGLVVDSQFDYYSDSLDMTIVSPVFDEVDKGSIIPHYEVRVTKTRVDLDTIDMSISVTKLP